MVLLALALAVAALLGWAIERGRPVLLPEAGATQLPCVSYAPFRRAGHSPFDAGLHIAPALIEADLQLLRRVTGCVRTYGLDHGLDAVPGIARRLGLRVVLGAWIGRDAAANAAQLERALALSREYADVVDLLVVGNEVLLRRELSPEALAALLAQARRASAVPVSYADVWEFWLRHGALLRDHVDVVSVHVLPYWEDEPVAAAQAVDHVHAIAARLREAFAPLPLFVAETGWPALGRQRGPARPGVLEQTRFVRELLTRQQAAPPAFSFNLIEGFDQPWKRALEGAMGGYWGLFDAEGGLRVTLSGPVVPDPTGWHVPLAAAVGALLAVVAALAHAPRGRRRAGSRPGLGPLLALGLSGAGIAALAWLQWQALCVWSRSPAEWALGSTCSMAALICAVAAALRLARCLATPDLAATPRPGMVDALREGVAGHLRWLACAQCALLFGVALTALGLVFDARYRALVWPLFAAPAVLLLALAALGDRLQRGAREERLLAAVCAAAALCMLAQEGWANTQALVAAATWLALAMATGWPHRAAPLHPLPSTGPGRPGRTHTSAASSTAEAPKSVE
jgi:exo-beta-1,3-glucanase (GH17 family)